MKNSKLRTVLLLVAITVLAAWLRWPGTVYPVALHFDEGSAVRAVLCNFPPSGTYAHPFLHRYLLSLPEGILCINTWLHGSTHAVTETRAAFALDPQPFLQWGRSISLLCGLATVVAIYLLGNALAGTAVGLSAALLLAVAPAHLLTSNNLTQWSLATLLATLSLYCMKVYGGARASMKQLALLGTVTGLATASAYTMVLLALPLMVVLAARWRENGATARQARDFGVVAAAALAGHVLGNLKGVLNPTMVLGQILRPTASRLGDQGVPVSYLGNVGWHFDALFNHQGLGLVVALLGLAGLALLVRRAGPMGWALLAFVAGIFLLQPLAVILMANRYIVPAFPVLVVAAAWLLVEAGRWVERRGPALARSRPGMILVILAALPGLLTNLDYRSVLALPTSRALALDWIKANIPPGTRLLVSTRFISPAIPDCRTAAEARVESASGNCYDVTFAPRRGSKWLADGAASSGSEYLVYVQAASERTMTRLGKSDETGRQLRERYPLVARFQHAGLERFHDDTAMVNPSIEIFKLRN